MTTLVLVPDNVQAAERWRQWQHAYVESSRVADIRARRVFTLVVAVLTSWLGLQLLRSWAA